MPKDKKLNTEGVVDIGSMVRKLTTSPIKKKVSKKGTPKKKNSGSSTGS